MSLAVDLERDLYAELDALPENLLKGGHWVVTGQFKDDDVVVMPPFEPLTLELESLCVPDSKKADSVQAAAD